MKLPAPKNQFARDIEIVKDIPVFATSNTAIRHRGADGQWCPLNQEAMDSRWRILNFTYQIPAEKQTKIDSCGKCFASLILLADPQKTNAPTLSQIL